MQFKVTLALLAILASVSVVSAQPVAMWMETSTGNDTLRVGYESTISFHVDPQGRDLFGIEWPLVFTFSDGNIVGPLRDGIEFSSSAQAAAVFESIAWSEPHGTAVTDPDTTLLGQVDLNLDGFTEAGEAWRITFTPTDAGTITIDSAFVPPVYHLEVAARSEPNVPIDWEPKTITVIHSCVVDVMGDYNSDGVVTSADIINMICLVFKGCYWDCVSLAKGDVNCNGAATSVDILILVDYVFRGVPLPCDICEDFYSGARSCP